MTILFLPSPLVLSHIGDLPLNPNTLKLGFMENFKHFCFFERKRIERSLRRRESRRSIADKLGRGLSSISDEIRVNSVNGKYVAEKADHKARVRRQNSKIQCMKVAMDPNLKKFVTKNILEDQSPEGISGRLKEVEKKVQYASIKAIYKFVWSVHGRRIEKHLYSKSVHKKGGPKRDTPVSIDGRTMIDERPKKVETRREFGHYEGDFIESGKDGRGSLLVIVERKTRYPFLRYLENRTTENVNHMVREMLGNNPIESLTIDNDISFQKHRELSSLIEAEIFFCHPQSPHEKGTIENRNKAIRRYVKKRTDLSTVPKETFIFVEERLRNKYMKCLNFKTPKEAFQKEIEKIEMKKSAESGIINNSILLAKSVRIEGVF
ncbi:MAG TPA: IS30 family transposase [Candidatus Paceibacterota bacterium]